MPGHPLKRTIKSGFHFLVAISGWALFVYWWNLVLPQIDSMDAFVALLFIGLTVVVTVLVTLLWVRYNIGIFHRKGPRKTLTHVAENQSTDFLGRRIERSGPVSPKTARLVVVSVEGEVKKYESDKS